MSDLNDPRVFFAAERTLLAWNRTTLGLMGFGFVIERFGLLMNVLSPQHGVSPYGKVSLWIGISFIVLGSIAACSAVSQYRKVLHSLKPAEIPAGYRVNAGVFVNLLVALLGIALSIHLFFTSRG